MTTNQNYSSHFLVLVLAIAAFSILYSLAAPSSGDSTVAHASITDNLIGHWQFDEGVGTTTQDASASGSTGTLQNGPLWITGHIGGALDFDRANDLVLVESHQPFDDMGPMTLSAWIKPDSVGESSSGEIVGKPDEASSGYWGLRLAGTNTTPKLNFRKDFSTTNIMRSSFEGAIQLGVWQHVAMTWDGSLSASNIKFYVNGSEVASYQGTANGSGTTSPDASIPLLIGNNLATTRTFDGGIDEVRVYNRVLSPTEISELFGENPPPPPPSPTDTTPPTVSLTNPAADATVSGTITLSATATDDIGVAGVQFKVDTANQGAEDTTSPYSVSWSTWSVPNGVHTITATARDAAGNATSTFVSVTVANEQATSSETIILIMTDDQRADTIWSMPTLQAELVAKGMTFTHGFIPLASCCPSRVSILTGNYAHTHGVRGNTHGAEDFLTLGREPDSIAVALQGAGWRTGLFGKYLNGYDLVPDPGTFPYMPPGWTRWVAFEYPRYVNFKFSIDGVDSGVQTGYSTARLFTEAATWIQAAAPTDKLFLYVTPFAPHSSVKWEAQDNAKFETFSQLGPAFNEADVSDKPAWVRDEPLWTQAETDAYIRFQRGQLRTLQSVDRGIAQILATLQATGRLDNARIIFVGGDNGFHWGEHRLRGKASPYEEAIRSAFVVRGPGIVQGSTTSALVANVDLPVTIAEWAGVPFVREGRSLQCLLVGACTSIRDQMLVEFFNGPGPFTGIRTADWKYIIQDSFDDRPNLVGEEELYDLVNDPYELESKHADPAYASVLADMRARLQAWAP